MSIKIKLYSDFVCPFCVIAKKPLFEAAAGKDVIIEWMPYELSPQNTPAHSTKSDYIRKEWFSGVVPLAERFGVTLSMPWDIDPIPKTQLAHEGYQFAKQSDKGWAYIQAVSDAYWLNGLDISNQTVLEDVASSCGLDQVAFSKALTERTFQTTHEKLLYHALIEEDIQAVPTVIIGNQHVTGLQSKQTYEQLISNAIANVSSGPHCSDDQCDITAE